MSYRARGLRNVLGAATSTVFSTAFYCAAYVLLT